uniref:Cytochrome P450 family 2 subfamily A member 6 gene 8 [provisional] n=1 Tax=Xenopus tropicalis TaxID=8364 RepID=A0A803JVB6_XENTR
MDTTWLWSLQLFLLIATMLIYSTWNKMYRKRNLPPGPTPIPLFGNVLQIKRGEMVKSLLELGKKYGPVYTLYFGPSPVIILCDYQSIKEALNDQAEEFSGRGKIPSWDQFFQGYGKPFDPTKILVQCVSNVICSVVFGQRYEYSNKDFHKLLYMFQAVFEDTSSTLGQLMTLLPNIMNHIPGPHKTVVNKLNKVNDFILQRVKENEKTLDPNSPRHFIDSFLIQMQKEKDNPVTKFHWKNLLCTIMNLFFAGTETVSTTLRHGFLMLLIHPEIEEKLHEEIDRVVGQDRSPTIEDRSKMPYTDAVIHEIQRFSDVLPMSLPHLVMKDTQFRGYTIPKGTDVYPLICAALRDPKQFATPNKFNPQHFLDDNGLFKSSNAFLPFSTGKRICLGEGLARMELFLFLTNILQNFKLHSENQFAEDDIAPKMNGFANYPLSYEFSLIPRVQSLLVL